MWKNDGQACFLDRCLHSSAARGARHTMKLVHDLLREVTATAAVAAAVPPASLCIETDSEEQRRTAGGPRNMQSRERLLYERRVRYEQGRFIAEASVPVHIAASARAHYNRLGGWAHHAFREAHAKYISERDLYNSIEGRWEAANQALQAASQAVAAPTADLTQSFQLYICAQQYLQAGEEFVKSAEAEDKVANGELARATEDLVVAGRALVRAEMTLCDFNRSYFSRGRDQGESFVSVPSVQSNPRHNLIEEEEDQEMQEYVEVSRNNASPNNAALPLDSAKMALVGTKSWSALHAPDDPPPVGQQSRAAATADDDDFEKLAQALLEGSSDQDTDETLSDCSNVDREKHKQGSPEEHEHGGRVRKMSPAAIQETALDREKYLERLTHTLKGARQNVRDAIARKNRAQIEVDRTLLLIGARTAGGWSLAAERCQTAAKAHRRARKGAGPVLKTAVERARMFRYLERLRSSTRHKLNQAWRARESARARAEPRTTALFAAAAATAAAAAASPNAHREARRIGAFYADDVTRTTTAGEMPQQVVPAEPMEEEGCPDDRALRRV